MNPYTLFLAAILLFSSLTDGLRRFSVGPITLQAVITILVSIGSVLLIGARGKLPKVGVSAISLLLIFLSVGWLSLHLNSKTSMVGLSLQIQNLLVYALFVGLILLSAIESFEAPMQPPWYITQGFLRAAQLTALLYGTSLLVGGLGTDLVMGARSFALFGIVGVAWCLASWRYRSPGQSGLWAIGLTALVALSFSRTATVICLLLFPLSQLSFRDSKSVMRVGLWMGLIALIAYLSFNYVQPIRARFTETGDSGQLGGVQVNTSGREPIWQAVMASSSQSPWIGKGPGSVAIPVTQVNSVAAGHPHNDYLRLLHDYGYIGLGLWIAGYATLLLQSWRYWIWADHHDRAAAHVHSATCLALMGVALAMLTDNVVVYWFVMAPLGMLVGASIGLGLARRRLVQKARPLAWMAELEASL
jgi:O-antigen ligase